MAELADAQVLEACRGNPCRGSSPLSRTSALVSELGGYIAPVTELVDERDLNSRAKLLAYRFDSCQGHFN